METILTYIRNRTKHLQLAFITQDLVRNIRIFLLFKFGFVILGFLLRQ